jgi:hypothetical protein
MAFRTTIAPVPDSGDEWPPGATDGLLSGDDLTDVDEIETSEDEDDF